MTKKRSSEIFADENRMKIEKNFGKGKIGKIFNGVRIYFRK